MAILKNACRGGVQLTKKSDSGVLQMHVESCSLNGVFQQRSLHGAINNMASEWELGGEE